MMESPPTKKRIGIIGGSFDPLHIGHLIVAQDAAEQLALSEVVFIPAYIPPHKKQAKQVDAQHRLKMLRMALTAEPRFSVSDIEVNRGGISYSVDTIEALSNLHPDAELFLIVGSDTLLELHTWHRIEDLLAMCSIATILRPGFDPGEEDGVTIKMAEPYRARLLEHVFSTHLIGISSTEIRKRVARGDSIRYLVPSVVEAYIYEQGLYQE